MKRKLYAGILAASLFCVGPSRAAQQAASSRQGSAATTQSEQPSQNQSAARRRSYEREVGRRHSSGISKKEMLFLAGIAGTSMGIGAIAGGAKGLAIGSIVGGWGAYAGHRLWKKIR